MGFKLSYNKSIKLNYINNSIKLEYIFSKLANQI